MVRRKKCIIFNGCQIKATFIGPKRLAFYYKLWCAQKLIVSSITFRSKDTGTTTDQKFRHLTEKFLSSNNIKTNRYLQSNRLDKEWQVFFFFFESYSQNVSVLLICKNLWIYEWTQSWHKFYRMAQSNYKKKHILTQNIGIKQFAKSVYDFKISVFFQISAFRLHFKKHPIELKPGENADVSEKWITVEGQAMTWTNKRTK